MTEVAMAWQEADQWRVFQNRFMDLACEEQGRGQADVITKGDTLRRMDRVLRMHCDYKNYPERVFVAEEVRSFYEPLGVELTSEDLSKIEAKTLEWAKLDKKTGLKAPETGRWMFGTGGVSENFRERVRLCVAEAGRALPDYPKGTDPEDFWLHRLWLDLLKNNSDSLLCASEEGGMIVSVCVASATFCSRLARKALEQSGEAGLVHYSRTGGSGWREMRRRAEQATIPTDEVQELGKKADAAILSLKAKFPQWRETPNVLNEIRKQERKCAELVVILTERGVEPNIGCGQLLDKDATPSPAQNNVKTAEIVVSKPATDVEVARPSSPSSWPEIEITFLSDERVEICSGDARKTYNYSELGFEDRRNGRPNRAWIKLREMAENGGAIQSPRAGKDLSICQKRIEEIRKKLRNHFGIGTDPIPFNGNTYKASFKISCRPSFNT